MSGNTEKCDDANWKTPRPSCTCGAGDDAPWSAHRSRLKQIAEDPAMPVWWGKNQAGMEAAEELSDEDDTVGVPGMSRTEQKWSPRSRAQRLWLEARDSALMYAQKLAAVGLHKQIANRVTEPWMWITAAKKP